MTTNRRTLYRGPVGANGSRWWALAAITITATALAVAFQAAGFYDLVR